jgi:hypothetical protein
LIGSDDLPTTGKVNSPRTHSNRAPQHIRLSVPDDAYERLCFLAVLPSLVPLRLMLADAPSPRGFGADLAVVGPLFKGFGRIVASPPYLVGYVRWDARSNQAHLLVRQSFSTALQIYSYSSHIVQEPKRAPHLLPHQEERLLHREVRAPKGRPEGARRDGEQSYNLIVPVKVENRRASRKGAATASTGGKGEASVRIC